MKYTSLGKSGIKVSQLCFGTMTFGEAADEQMSADLYAMCRDAGINFFDCANVYAKGKSELILGKLCQDQRHEVLLATKAYYPMSQDVNARGTSRKQLRLALEGSLRRLNTDYIDVYYLHNFDTNTSLEETISTLHDFIREGKILYIGVSNFAAWQVMKAQGIIARELLTTISCIQPMYNLLKRQCESELLPMALNERISVFPYSPIAGGYLTGKYLNNKPDEGRFNTSKMYQKRYEDEQNEIGARKFIEFASDNNYDPVSLAVAWVSGHAGVTAPIIGARNTVQLKPALESISIDMTDELRATISEFTITPAMANDREDDRGK